MGTASSTTERWSKISITQDPGGELGMKTLHRDIGLGTLLEGGKIMYGLLQQMALRPLQPMKHTS